MKTRNCPKCNKEIEYKCVTAFYTARKRGTLCTKCTFNSDSFKSKMHKINSGKNNAMYGKSVYNKWIEKYGVEEADKRMGSAKEKWSKNATGKNNSMYGKPTPKKAGNGWSGWYKDHFFRSLRELSYILHMEENNIRWKSAENIRIPYINYDGSERTYSPDFMLEDKKIVEIKPERLINSPLIKLKTKALAKYCEENNLEYEIIDFEICDVIKITKLLEIGDLKLTERTHKKYETYLYNNAGNSGVGENDPS